MEKYLRAIEKAKEEMQMHHDCRVKACSDLERAYTPTDALEMYYLARNIIKGIRLVAMVDHDIDAEAWHQIVERGNEIEAHYFDEYNEMIKKIMKELGNEE